jgi:hypothetical protein
LSWNIQQTREPKLIRLLFLLIIRRSAKCVIFIWMSSWMFPLPRNSIFHVEDNSRHFSQIRQIRRFESERFLLNSPKSYMWKLWLVAASRHDAHHVPTSNSTSTGDDGYRHKLLSNCDVHGPHVFF